VPALSRTRTPRVASSPQTSRIFSRGERRADVTALVER